MHPPSQSFISNIQIASARKPTHTRRSTRARYRPSRLPPGTAEPQHTPRQQLNHRRATLTEAHLPHIFKHSSSRPPLQRQLSQT